MNLRTRLADRPKPYIDTLSLRLPRALSHEEVKRLPLLCGSYAYRSPGKCKPIQAMVSGRSVSLPASLLVHQPQPELVRWIAAIFPKSVLVTRLDLAMDILSESRADAQAKFAWLKPRLMKPWFRASHKIQELGETESSTLYIGFESWRSKIRAYCGRLSKITGGPCVHIEYSLCSSSSVKSAGLSDIEDALTFRHAQFWRRKLRLAEVNVEALGKCLRGRRPNVRTKRIPLGHGTLNVDSARGFAVLKAAAAARACSVKDLQIHEAIEAVRKTGVNPKRVIRLLDIRRYVPFGSGMPKLRPPRQQ